MNLYWEEDKARRGYCWDLRNEDGDMMGWVIEANNGKWQVRPYPYLSESTGPFDTKEEAMAVLVALVRFN